MGIKGKSWELKEMLEMKWKHKGYFLRVCKKYTFLECVKHTLKTFYRHFWGGFWVCGGKIFRISGVKICSDDHRLDSHLQRLS